jgi:hypothetical protein
MSIQSDAEALLETARREDRLALQALEQAGPPVRLKVVADIAGISKAKVRDDAKRGHLTVVQVRCGTRWMALVDRPEALRYLRQLFKAA